MKRLIILKGTDDAALRLALNMDDTGVLLMQDAVYYAHNNTERAHSVKNAIQEGKQIYVLEADTSKRGLADRTLEGVQGLDTDSLVDLLFSGATVLNL